MEGGEHRVICTEGKGSGFGRVCIDPRTSSDRSYRYPRTTWPSNW